MRDDFLKSSAGEITSWGFVATAVCRSGDSRIVAGLRASARILAATLSSSSPWIGFATLAHPCLIQHLATLHDNVLRSETTNSVRSSQTASGEGPQHLVVEREVGHQVRRTIFEFLQPLGLLGRKHPGSVRQVAHI